MQQIAQFEKVSFDQFFSFFYGVALGQEDTAQVVRDRIKEEWDAIMLPSRATTGSAGYDIHTPVSFTLHPNESVTFPTGLRVKIEPGWFLMCAPRSGMGFKYKARLANTVGIIDSDYYNSDNEGHIMVKLCNEGDKTLCVKAGDAVAQGILLPYGITVDDHATAVRNGGFGSTGA